MNEHEPSMKKLTIQDFVEHQDNMKLSLRKKKYESIFMQKRTINATQSQNLEVYIISLKKLFKNIIDNLDKDENILKENILSADKYISSVNQEIPYVTLSESNIITILITLLEKNIENSCLVNIIIDCLISISNNIKEETSFSLYLENGNDTIISKCLINSVKQPTELNKLLKLLINILNTSLLNQNIISDISNCPIFLILFEEHNKRLNTTNNIDLKIFKTGNMGNSNYDQEYCELFLMFISKFNSISYTDSNFELQLLMQNLVLGYIINIYCRKIDKENKEYNTKILICCYKTLKYLSLTSSEKILHSFVKIDNIYCKSLLEILIDLSDIFNNNEILILLLIIIGNLESNDDKEYLNQLFNLGLLDFQIKHLKNENSSSEVKSKIFWAFSNLCLEKECLSYLNYKDVFSLIFGLIKKGCDANVCVQILFCIDNTAESMDERHIKFLRGVSKVFVDLLQYYIENNIIIVKILACLTTLFQKENNLMVKKRINSCLYLKEFNLCNGEELLRKLSFNKNEKVSLLSQNLLNLFYPNQNTDLECDFYNIEMGV